MAPLAHDLTWTAPAEGGLRGLLPRLWAVPNPFPRLGALTALRDPDWDRLFREHELILSESLDLRHSLVSDGIVDPYCGGVPWSESVFIRDRSAAETFALALHHEEVAWVGPLLRITLNCARDAGAGQGWNTLSERIMQCLPRHRDN